MTVLLRGTFAAARGAITTLARSTKGLTGEKLSKTRRYTGHQSAKGREERHYPFLRTPIGRMRALQTCPKRNCLNAVATSCNGNAWVTIGLRGRRIASSIAVLKSLRS